MAVTGIDQHENGETGGTSWLEAFVKAFGIGLQNLGTALMLSELAWSENWIYCLLWLYTQSALASRIYRNEYK